MNPCDECEKPIGVKCCFNCARDAETCEVWHDCGIDCPGWEKIEDTENANMLKPCPFCGQEAIVITWIRDNKEMMYRVCCDNEKCLSPSTDFHVDKSIVMREWNRRADDGT